MEHRTTGASLMGVVVFLGGMAAAFFLVVMIYVARKVNRIEAMLRGEKPKTGPSPSPSEKPRKQKDVRIRETTKRREERTATDVCTGKLVDSGIGQRDIHQGNGTKTINQFYVDLMLKSTRRVERIWGANLQDGLSTTQARYGDILRISNLGKRPGTRMNLFAIKVLQRQNAN